VEYLGHIISREGVAANPAKISSMLDWPIPKTVTGLRGFLGLTGYYRNFVRDYGKICRPLTSLLKKGNFAWTAEAKKAFNALKEAMTTTLVLALLDFTQPFVIKSDACRTGIGTVLMQSNRPIAFTSKALPPRHLGLSTYEKEMTAIIHAVTKWRTYLVGHLFIIKTDHQSLKHFLDAQAMTPTQQKWLTKLLGYDYTISYKRGIENRVVDALSRQQEESVSLSAISYVHLDWLDRMKEDLKQDPWIQAKISKLQHDHFMAKHYSMQDGLLQYDGRIVVSPDSPWHIVILNELHASPAAGHSGYLKMV
jgi:hypothetical protein